MNIEGSLGQRDSKQTVIFLGAGASAAEGAPLQNALFRNYFESIRSSGPYEPTRHMDRELVTFFYIMFGIDVDYGDLSKINFPTFEEALGILDLAEIRRESFKDFGLQTSASNSGRIGHIRQYLVLAMAKVIAAGLLKSKSVHKTLVKNLSDKNLLSSTSFISTNYDISIDNALATYKNCKFGETVNYGVDFANYEQGGWAKPKLDATKLLKIHGSLNWLYCPACNDLKITPFKKGMTRIIDNPGETLCKSCESPMSPVVIPPTFYKDMSNVFLSTVWNRAEAALRKADQVVFCGYSFPDADMHIKYLLKRAETNRRMKDPLQFKIINHYPGKDKAQAKAEELRYKRFLNGYVNFTDVSFEEFAAEPNRFY